MNLPKEYLQFIKNQKGQIVNFKKLAEEYEDELEKLQFLSIDKLTVEERKIHIPNGGGYYIVECVILTNNLEGSVVWFPKWKAFGCLDEDTCFVCKGKSWNEISENTYKYLIGRWEWEEGEEFEVDFSKENCPFVPYKNSNVEKNKSYYFEKAAEAIQNEKYDEAIKHYADYPKNCEIKSPIDSAEVYGKTADVYLSYLRDYDSAINFYKKALMFNPSNINYYNNRSSAYFARQEYDKSIIDLDKSLEIDPESYFAHYRKGVTLYFGLKDIKGIDWFIKCLSLPTVKGSVFKELIEHYIIQNNPKEALKIVEKWEEINPPHVAPKLGRENNVVVIYLKSIILKLLNEDEEAINMEGRFKSQMTSLYTDGYNWNFTDILDWTENIKDKETKEFIKRVTNDFKDYINE